MIDAEDDSEEQNYGDDWEWTSVLSKALSLSINCKILKFLYSRMMEMRRMRPKENLEICLRKREETNSTGKASINARFDAKLFYLNVKVG